jgi:hypothetical protein
MDELESHLRDWLGKNGYPLELRSAYSAIKEGFSPRQGSHYIDPDTGKLREIDVVVEREVYEEEAWISFAACVECKSGADHPWIGFCQPQAARWPVRLSQVNIGSPNGLALFRLARRQGTPPDIVKFVDERRPGCHGIVRALGKSAEDIPYGATLSAAKAARDFAAKSAGFAEAAHEKYFGIVFPLVVVDTPLFLCSIDLSGALTLERTEALSVSVRTGVDPADHTYVHVLTETGFGAFTSGLGKTLDWLAKNQANRIKAMATGVPLSQIEGSPE